MMSSLWPAQALVSSAIPGPVMQTMTQNLLTVDKFSLYFRFYSLLRARCNPAKV